jgi:hypothetical protein
MRFPMDWLRRMFVFLSVLGCRHLGPLALATRIGARQLD